MTFYPECQKSFLARVLQNIEMGKVWSEESTGCVSLFIQRFDKANFGSRVRTSTVPGTQDKQIFIIKKLTKLRQK